MAELVEWGFVVERDGPEAGAGGLDQAGMGPGAGRGSGSGPVGGPGRADGPARQGRRLVALDPSVVARRRMEREFAAAAERVALLSELPAVSDELSGMYQRAQLTGGGSAQYIDDVTAVNARLDHVIAGAEFEILSAQPGGPRTRVQLERSVSRDQQALERGVSMLTLYRDSVRTSTAMADHIRRMSGHGGEYRTLVAPYERCIVVDRQHAFISAHTVEGAPPHAAWHVTDPAALGFILAVFGDALMRATVWRGESRTDTTASGGPGVRTTPLQRAILRDMVAGIEQRITAGRLGISLRKLTDEIGEMKDRFGAVSLTQLAYKFALSADHAVDDDAPCAPADPEAAVA
mgnify:CR=1 FL=1